MSQAAARAGSLVIGGGEGLQGVTGKSLQEAGGASTKVITELQKIAEAITTNAYYNDHETLTIPEFLLNPLFGGIIAWINNRSWKVMTKNNGGKVDAKPFVT